MNRDEVFSGARKRGTKETKEKYGKGGQFQKLGKGLAIAIICIGTLLAIKVGVSADKEKENVPTSHAVKAKDTRPVITLTDEWTKIPNPTGYRTTISPKQGCVEQKGWYKGVEVADFTTCAGRPGTMYVPAVEMFWVKAHDKTAEAVITTQPL